jgi:hypothetical protein
MKNKKYIYESPDGGKTIYRREFGDYDKREKLSNGGLYIEVPEDYWTSTATIGETYNPNKYWHTKEDNEN